MPRPAGLAPVPRSIKPRPGIFRRARVVTVHSAHPRSAFGELHADLATALGDRSMPLRWTRTVGDLQRASIRITIDESSSRHPHGYALTVERDAIRITATHPVGAYHAVQTLRQWAFGRAARIPCVQIDDYPDFTVRGIMLDISRDKVPSMATLFGLIDGFAALKLNQLQLYTEHTFAYRGHKAVWKYASPLTPAQVRTLDRYCRRRFIELVPNQNCFGHMERWLKHGPYAGMAEAIGPCMDPWGGRRTVPTTLCPIDPVANRFVGSLLDALVPCFTSRQVNVGCDETWELGQGRSAEACVRDGKGRVYLNFLLAIHQHVKRHGRVMQFWADIVHEHPELIRELPRDMVPLEWGYEADHPFDSHNRALKSAGLSFYVCPGTSTWCSYAGRTTNAMANLRNAARLGATHGATGYLITDWGDGGHPQYLPASYGPFLFGAGCAWNSAAARTIDHAAVTRTFDTGGDDRLSECWSAAGEVYRYVGALLKNQSALYRIMQTPWSTLVDTAREPFTGFSRITSRTVTATESRIRQIERRLTRIRPRTLESRRSMTELRNTLRIMSHACARWRAITLRRRGELRQRLLRQLIQQLSRIAQEHKRLWRLRNRPGGLPDSLAHFQRNQMEYAAECAALRR